MAKSRITVTLEPHDEEIVRGAAAEYGLDLSAFLRTAALAEAERLAQVKARFAEIDAINRSVDEAAPTPEESDPEADAAMDAFLDAIEHGDRGRGAVA